MAKRIEVTIVGNSAGFERSLVRSGAMAQGFGAKLSSSLGMAAKVGVAALGGLGVASIKSAIDFESSFAGVRKTVEATPKQFDQLAQSLRNMAKEIPASVNDLNRIAESAGALGIKRQNIIAFTRTIADMGETTNLVGEEAAATMARLANITKMPQTEFRRLGSTIVDLGNKGASTEAEIAAMGLRLAAAGKQAGMSLPEILGFANAMSSVGIEAEAGGSAMSRTFAKIGSAVMEGGKSLDGFAKVAGMSGAQFQKAFKDDAAGAVLSFVEGLDRIKQSGGNVYETLKSLDITDVRSIDTLLRLAGAGDLARKSIEDGNSAWQKGSALQDEARKRYETTAAQLEILKNRAVDFGITVGNAVVPQLVAALPHIEALGQRVESWGPQISSGVNIAKTALGGLGSIASSNIGQFGIVAAGSAVAFSAAMSKIVASYKAMKVAIATTSPFGLAAVAVGLLAGAFYTLVTAGERTSQALRDARAAIEALKGTADSARGAQLSLAEAKNRLRQASLDVASAIRTKQQAESAAGQGSLQYKQAQNQVEAAYIARQRAALQVGLAEDKVLTTQQQATAVQKTATQAVQALTQSYKSMEERATAYAGAGDRASESAKGIERTKAALYARDYADKMRDLGDRAAKAAKDLETTNPALAKVAAGIAKAAESNAKFATETSKIPAAIDQVKGPAVTAVGSLATGVAAAATAGGSQVGANFATGMAAGIAANASAASIQAAMMVNKAYSAASTAGQMKSPSRLTMALGRDFVEGFILGINEKTPEVKGKVTQAVVDSLQAARNRVASFQVAFADEFGKLGEYAKRAFAAKTQNMLDSVSKKFDAQIAKWQTYASAATPAEKALAELDSAEAKRSRDAALRAAQDALTQAEAMDAGVEKERAVAAAKEQIRQAELANTRAALTAQAETERAAREAEAAAYIAKLEATKARELQNLEERRRQLGEQLDGQLTTLQERLAKHPEEYDKIQKKIQALLRSYGVPMEKSGELLGKAFARGLASAADDVERAAKKLAKIVEAYWKGKSPTEKGPMSTLDTWWSGVGKTLAGGLDFRPVEHAAGRLAGSLGGIGGFGHANIAGSVAGGRVSASGGYATPTGGGRGSVVVEVHNHFQGPVYSDERGLEELTGKIRAALQRQAGRNS